MPDEIREIRVRYFDTQDAEELYKAIDTKKVYVRQPANVDEIVFWLTSVKWRGGYEADCPIREGIAMVVVDGENNELFRELPQKDDWNGGTSAKKEAPFIDEALRAYAKDAAERYLLASHQQWTKWLWQAGEEKEYGGYRDNWLYFESKCTASTVIEQKTILGEKYEIVRNDYQHKLCNLKWQSFFINKKGNDICEEICGYIFD